MTQHFEFTIKYVLGWNNGVYLPEIRNVVGQVSAPHKEAALAAVTDYNNQQRMQEGTLLYGKTVTSTHLEPQWITPKERNRSPITEGARSGIIVEQYLIDPKKKTLTLDWKVRE